jgi:transporter family protein
MRPEIYIIMAILGWGIGSFLYKPATNAIHPIIIFAFTMLAYIIVNAILWLTIKFDHTITLAGSIYAFIGSVFMCLGTLGFALLLRTGDNVGHAIILTSLYPALTLVLSAIFYGETLTPIRCAGILLALVSFALLSH